MWLRSSCRSPVVLSKLFTCAEKCVNKVSSCPRRNHSEACVCVCVVQIALLLIRVGSFDISGRLKGQLHVWLDLRQVYSNNLLKYSVPSAERSGQEVRPEQVCGPHVYTRSNTSTIHTSVITATITDTYVKVLRNQNICTRTNE